MKLGLCLASMTFCSVTLAHGLARAHEESSPIDVVRELERIPGLTVLQEQPAPQAGYRFFVMSFTQPVDHLDPRRGTFEQRVTLMHRSPAAPTLAYTTGYFLPVQPFLDEPALLVDGNQVGIEERFFDSSIPDDPDYADLNIYQAAADHHRLIEALKAIYRRPWLSSGASKGGMATVYHRRFFDEDLDGSVVYVAPNDVVNDEDSYDEFLANVGTASCRESLIAVTRAALQRRGEIVPLLEVVAAELGYTYFYVGGMDAGFESAASSIYWSFWQRLREEDCASIPAPDAPIAELAAFISRTSSLLDNDDVTSAYFFPYQYQAATQLGYPDVSGWRTAIEDLLLHDEPEVEPGEEPSGEEESLIEFDSSAMADIDHWVKTEGHALLFIYGENDPWSAEPFELGPGTRDSAWYMVAGGNHASGIGDLPDSDRLDATNRVRRWAGLEPIAALPEVIATAGASSGTGAVRALRQQLQLPVPERSRSLR